MKVFKLMNIDKIQKGIAMIKVLQVYDSTAINAGINIEIMNINRNINHDECIFDFLSSWKKEPNFDSEIQKNGGESFYIYQLDHIANPIKFILSVKRFFKKNAHKYDVIHLHTGQFCFPYLYYAKKYGIEKRIVHAHSVSLGNTKISSLRNSLLLFPMKRLATNYIACSNEAANEWFKKRGIHNYEIITNGIEIERFQYNERYRVEFRQELGIGEQKLIVHISNMTRLKNVPFLLQVFKRLRKKRENILLLLVGRNELPSSIQELITQYDLNNSVINYGITDNIVKVLCGSDLCIMPSLSEGFGIVPIECQCCHIPVIISRGFPEIIKASKYAERLSLNNIEKWVEKADMLLDRDYISDLSVSTEMNRFSINNVADQILEFYKT